MLAVRRRMAPALVMVELAEFHDLVGATIAAGIIDDSEGCEGSDAGTMADTLGTPCRL